MSRVSNMNLNVRAIGLLLVSVLCIDICSATYALNHTCSPPYSMGGKGYCGPNFCDTSASKNYGCNFTNSVFSYSTIVSNTKTKTCTQSTDARCTSAALSALMHGPGIKAAFCNDAFLIILSDLTTGFNTQLNAIKNPPASVDGFTGKPCVTRYKNPGFQSLKIPLVPVMLLTSDPSINNVNLNSFPNGPASDSDGSYMSTSTGAGATYGLPVRGAVGVTIAGQIIFPVFNNLAYLAPQKCEVDTCNEHVGGGGGQPHLHGDPFGTWCLYSQLNYSSIYVHPPQIGWSLDGYTIYGRHLSTSNDGYSTALDQCGGHIHGSYAYHYHSQILNATTDNGAVPGQKSGQPYYASTTGPYKCFKGDISQITNFWGKLATSHISVSPDVTGSICTGSSQYYNGAGMVLPATVASPTLAPSPSPAPTPTPTADPTPTPPTLKPAYPTTAPTSIPTASPTSGPVAYSVSQVITGVNVTSAAQIASFDSAFTTSVAGILGVSTSSVVVTSLTAMNSRRLSDVEANTIESVSYVGAESNDIETSSSTHRRPFLQLTNGVTVAYTATASATTLSAVTSTLTSHTSTVQSALVNNGFSSASVQTPSVSTFAPSYAPTAAPSKSPVSGSARVSSNYLFTLSVLALVISFSK